MIDDSARIQKDLDDFISLWENLTRNDEIERNRKQENWNRFQAMIKKPWKPL